MTVAEMLGMWTRVGRMTLFARCRLRQGQLPGRELNMAGDIGDVRISEMVKHTT
jgi:hypothetical protein